MKGTETMVSSIGEWFELIEPFALKDFVFVLVLSSDIERKAEELPYQLEMADNKEKLKEALTDLTVFRQMYQESNKQQLMKYWRFIGGYNIASQAYVKSLKDYIRVN